MRVEKTVWNSMKAIGGFVVGAVTVFGWLSVTPEMVGQVTYDVMRGPAPLAVMFVSGSLFGWGATKLWSDRRMKEASEAHDAAVAKRISSGLDGMSGFEHVDDLDALIKKARGLSTLQRQLASRDAKIASLEAELAGRPTQEDVDELRAMLDKKDAEKRRVKAILSSLDDEKKGLVGIALSNGAIDEHTEPGNRAFLFESGILSRVDPSPIKPFASYTLSSLAASILAEDAELTASVVDRCAELSRRIQERSEGSKRNSMLRELRKGFRALDPCQRSVVMSAYFAEAEGYVPKNDDERRVAANASDDLVLRDMVRYDKSSGRLFLADDARAMIEDGDGAQIGRAVRDGMESEVVTMRERAAKAEARLAEHEDEDAKKRKKAESEVIVCVRSMGFYARKLIYRIMTEGPQTIDDDWLGAMEGAYFFDRITFKTRLKNHKSKVDMKPGIKAFLMENPELFDEVREEVAHELEERQRAESRVLATGKPMSTGGRPVGDVIPAGMMTAASGLAESLNRAMKQMEGASGEESE